MVFILWDLFYGIYFMVFILWDLFYYNKRKGQGRTLAYFKEINSYKEFIFWNQPNKILI